MLRCSRDSRLLARGRSLRALALLVAFVFAAFLGCESVKETAKGIGESIQAAFDGAEIEAATTDEATSDQDAEGTAPEEPGDPPAADGWDLASLDTGRQSPYLTPVEKDVVLELNKVRSDPARYASIYLEPMRNKFHGNIYREPGQIDLMTQEGVKALEDCIRELNRTAARSVLSPSSGLTRAARDHVEDTGPRGTVGHSGSDGSDSSDRVDRYGEWDRQLGENISYGEAVARDIVIQLLIDDGVPSRGHRRNILESAFSRVGVAVGPHRTYGAMCVIDFAGSYSEKGS